jgi:hypothetical protein
MLNYVMRCSTRSLGYEYIRAIICNVGQEIAEGKLKRAAAGKWLNH